MSTSSLSASAFPDGRERLLESAVAGKLGTGAVVPRPARKSGTFRQAPPPALIDDRLHSRVIAEWEHFAVLTLLEVRGFEASAEWIAARLGIPVARAREVWETLQGAGFVVRDEGTGRFRAGEPSYSTSEDVRSVALREAHRGELRKISEDLESVAVTLRDVSSITMAVNPGKLHRAKQMIRRFRKEMAECLESGPRTEVYLLAVQLFPLTRAGKRRRE